MYSAVFSVEGRFHEKKRVTIDLDLYKFYQSISVRVKTEALWINWSHVKLKIVRTWAELSITSLATKFHDLSQNVPRLISLDYVQYEELLVLNKIS